MESYRRSVLLAKILSVDFVVRFREHRGHPEDATHN